MKSVRRTLALGSTLVALSLALGCQIPFLGGTPQANVVVSYGSLSISPTASLAIAMRFDNTRNFLVQDLQNSNVQKVVVTVVGSNLAQPITVTVTRDNFNQNQAIANFTNLPDGPVTVSASAIDANGTVLSYATGAATIIRGQTAVLTLLCQANGGALQVIYDCPDCSEASPTPTPIPTPTPSPTPTPAGTVIQSYSTGHALWGIDVDASGSIWVSNNETNTVSRFYNGALQSDDFLVQNGPTGLAVDTEGNVWVANQRSGTVSKLSSNGVVLNTFNVGGAPEDLEVDLQGNVWGANWAAGSIFKIPSDGSSVVQYSASDAQEIAIDASGNVWVTNSSTHLVTKIPANGSAPVNMQLSFSPHGIAIDGSGHLWITHLQGNKVTKCSADDQQIHELLHVTVGSNPYEVAVSPSNVIWVSSVDSNTITKISESGDVLQTIQVGAVPYKIAFDLNGNVLVAHYGSGNVLELAP